MTGRSMYGAIAVAALLALCISPHARAQATSPVPGTYRPPGTFMPRPPEPPGGNCAPNCPQVETSTGTYHSEPQAPPRRVDPNRNLNPTGDPDVQKGINQYLQQHQ